MQSNESQIQVICNRLSMEIPRNKFFGLLPDDNTAWVKDINPHEVRNCPYRFVQCMRCEWWIPEKTEWEPYGIKLCRSCTDYESHFYSPKAYAEKKTWVPQGDTRPDATIVDHCCMVGDLPLSPTVQSILVAYRYADQIVDSVVESFPRQLPLSDLGCVITHLYEAYDALSPNPPVEVTQGEKLTKQQLMTKLTTLQRMLRVCKNLVTAHTTGPNRVKALRSLGLADAAAAQFKVLVNELPEEKVAVMQMDGAESVLSSLAAPLLEKGTAFLGKAVQSAFGTPKGHDSPAVVNSSPLDLALSDIPREVKSVAFTKDAETPDFKDVCQQSTHDAQHLLKRCMVPSLYRQSNWAVSSAAGTFLLTTAVEPGLYPSANSGGTSRTNTILSYLSEFYALWRGELIFTVEVICTRFHQGQLFLAFDPSSQASPSLSDLETCLCASLDLSVSNRTDFVIPFVSDSDYKKVYSKRFGTAPWNSFNRQFQIGNFHVVVQNALLAPPSVSPNISINLYIRAGPSFQFAVPRSPQTFVAVDGVVQGDEVQEDNRTSVNSGKEIDNMDPINPLLPVSTWTTADTSNIVGREYLLRTGIGWSTSSTFGTNLNIDILPDTIINKTNLAINGLTSFHAYTRFGLRFTLRWNSSPFYAGLVVFYFNPSGDQADADNTYTVFQLPHVLFNPAGEQAVTLDVPWAYWKRLRFMHGETIGESYGVLGITVISPLLAPPSATTTLNASLWFSTIDPYVGVKCVKGVPQGDATTSDPSKGVLTAPRPWNSDGITPGGYIGDHMDVLALLRRPDFYLNMESSFSIVPRGPLFKNIGNLFSIGGAHHLKLLRLWRFWSGSRRVHLLSPTSVTNTQIYFLTPDFESPYDTSLVPDATVTREMFNGTQIWRPGNEPAVTVEIPYYHYAPLTICPTALARSTGPDQEACVLRVSSYFQYDSINSFGTGTPAGVTLIATALTSVGDDFHLYLPLMVPRMFSVAGARVDDQGKVEGIDVKMVFQGDQMPRKIDLTVFGCVEKNPGPAFSKFAAETTETSVDADIPVRELDRLFEEYQRTEQSPSRVSRLWNSCLDFITRTVSTKLAERAKVKLSSLKDDFSQAIVPSLIWAIDFILNIYILATSTSKVAKSLALASLGAKCVLAYRHGTLLLNKLTEVYKDPVGWVMQGDDDVNSHKEIAMLIAGALLAGIVGVMGFGVHNSDLKNVKNLASMRFAETCAGIGKIANGVKGIDYLWHATVGGTKAAIDYFVDGESMFTSWFEVELPKIKAWQRQWDELRSSGLTSNNAVFKGRTGDRPYDKLLKLSVYAQELRVKGPLLKTFPQHYLRTANEIITRTNTLTEMQNVAFGRPEPVGVLMYGGAGCGKSFMTTTVLPRAVLQELKLAMTTEEAQAKVYSKPRDPDQRYMDGYTSQPWVVIDDFGQNTDDKDFADIINLISVSNCPVPMAAMDEKKTVFDSPFVICTTNLSSFHGVNTVKDQTALSRRFQVGIQLSARGDRFNATLFTDDLKKTDVFQAAERHWKIETHNFALPNEKGTEISFAQLVTTIANHYRTRQTTKLALDTSLSADKFALPVVAKPQGETEDYFSAEDVPDFVTRRRVWCNTLLELGPEHYLPLRQSVIEDPEFYGPDQRQDAEFMRCLQLTEEHDAGPTPVKWKGLAAYIAGVLALTAGAALAVALLVRMVKSTFKYYFGVMETEQQGGYEKGEKIINRKVTQVKGVKAVLQGQTDKVTMISRNVRRVQMVIDGVAWGMNALAIDSRNLLVPKHFYDKYCKEYAAQTSPRLEMEMTDRAGARLGFKAFSMSAYNVQEVKGPEIMRSCALDLVVVRLVGCNVDHARSILHLMKTLEDYKHMMGTELEAYFLGVRSEGCKARLRFHHLVVSQKVYAYPGLVSVPSQAGDCGRPYVTAQVADQRPLCGVHVAWIPEDKMIAMVPTIRECVDIALLKLDHTNPPVVEVKEVSLEAHISEGTPSRFWKTAIENHGPTTVNNEPLSRHVMDTTQFVRTQWRHPDWCDNFEPSVKRVVTMPGDKVHPLYTNAQKYEPIAPYVMPTRIHNKAIAFMKTRINPLDVYDTLDDDAAINGYGSMTPLVMSTSSGYWSKYYANGKKEFFDAKPITFAEDGSQNPLAYVFSVKAKQFEMPLHKKTFYDHYTDCQRMLEKGEAIPTYWVSTLKDELLKTKKVAIGKTRVFEQPGLEFTLLMRKYFGHFVHYYKSHPGFRLFHGIGVDKEAAWGAYWREMNVWDGRGFDLDYSNFDGTVPVAAFDAFLAVTDHFYGEKDRIARHALMHSLRSSLIIVGTDFVETVQGNKSGNPLTDMFNSICGSYLMLCFYLLSREMYGLSVDFDDFDREVRMLTYGDDVIVSASAEARQYFNRQVCVSLAQGVGMKATSAAKNGDVVADDLLTDLTFLKSPFVEHNGIVLAPLPKEVIHREIMWQHKGNVGDVMIMEQRIETAQRMMAHHGKQALQELQSQFKSLGVETHLDWDEWFLEVANKQALFTVEAVSGSKDIVPLSWEVPDDWQQWSKTVEVDWLSQGDIVEDALGLHGHQGFPRMDTALTIVAVQQTLAEQVPRYLPLNRLDTTTVCLVAAVPLGAALDALVSMCYLSGSRPLQVLSLAFAYWRGRALYRFARGVMVGYNDARREIEQNRRAMAITVPEAQEFPEGHFDDPEDDVVPEPVAAPLVEFGENAPMGTDPRLDEIYSPGWLVDLSGSVGDDLLREWAHTPSHYQTLDSMEANQQLGWTNGTLDLDMEESERTYAQVARRRPVRANALPNQPPIANFAPFRDEEVNDVTAGFTARITN